MFDIAEIETLIDARLVALRQAKEVDQFLAVARSVCDLTRDANLSIARSLRPDPAEIKSAKEICGIAADRISNGALDLPLSEDAKREVAAIASNIVARLRDLDRTALASQSS